MKVACVGNMNNNFFSLVRYLRGAGIEADLILLAFELDHFSPENDTFRDEYKNFTKQVAWGDLLRRKYYEVPVEIIRKDLEPYDFIIASGCAPSFIHRAGMVVDVFIPHGSDFSELPFFLGKSIFETIKNLLFFPLHLNQRRGLKKTRVLSVYHHSGGSNDRVNQIRTASIKKLGVAAKTVYLGLPMVYTEEYTKESMQKDIQRSQWHDAFKKVREKYDTIIFHHARHQWTSGSASTIPKGNDRLIRGFAKFLKANPLAKAGLILFEFGRDVQASRGVIKELNIEHAVTWFPLMPRKEIMIGLSMADIGTGQFAFGSVGGGTNWEVLVSGKPLLHYHAACVPTMEGLTDYPFINVHTEEEICKALENFLCDRERFIDLGKRGAEWYKKYYAGVCVDRYVELIRAKEKGVDITSFAKKWKK